MPSSLKQPIWPKIQAHSEHLKQLRLLDLFANEADRASNHLLSVGGLTLDYSKNFYTDETRGLMLSLCEQSDLTSKIEQMFSGSEINNTEVRPALHSLLRSPEPYNSALGDLHQNVQETLQHIENIAEAVRSGTWQGATGESITDVLHIGIGGSFLGPNMVDEALSAQRAKDRDIQCHYVANVDGHHINSLLTQLNPATTLLIVVSKTFTTLETKANAETAKTWLLDSVSEVSPHLIAVSTNIQAAVDFGVSEENILPIWDWVGGRYSLWSAVGLPIAIRYGFDVFNSLLNGAATMDRHFVEAPLDQNIPVILGFLGVLYQHCFDAPSHAVLTYDHRLRLLPDHLQQLDMESNGKSVDVAGEPIDHHTGAIIWGGEGTNGQHAFHQLLHQGTRFTGIDFIMTLKPDHKLTDHHDKLIASCLSQAQALMVGRGDAELAGEPSPLRAHKQMPGNRPSNIIALDRLDAEAIGALVAMYEHKVFVQAMFWNINPFDQWGVELGKELGQSILEAIEGAPVELDASTNQLLSLYQRIRNT